MPINQQNENKQLHQLRVDNFKKIFDKSGLRSITAFCKHHKLPQATITTIIAGKRYFTDTISLNTERKLGLPNGYLSLVDDSDSFYYLPLKNVITNNSTGIETLNATEYEIQLPKILLGANADISNYFVMNNNC